jgi:N-glycosylase/DNA lyase
MPGQIVFAAPFDLAATLASGQVFHWDNPSPGTFAGLIGEDPAVLHQPVPGAPVEVLVGETATVGHYLGHDHDLPAIQSTFPRDQHIAAALAWSPGLRILRQPRWECTATFITSSMKNIPAIRKMSLEIRSRFGQRTEADGHVFHTYPDPDTLAAAGETALRQCGLGYRAKSLASAAGAVASGAVDLAAPASAVSLEEARAHLTALRGVGPKVADCVLLFAYGRTDAFPIDVWVERIVLELYLKKKHKKNRTPAKVRAFAESYFGPHRGYAQQFLFHHARHHLKAR